jgi:hypothetical protein
MVVGDFYFIGIAVTPFEADAPLTAYPDAPLIPALAGKSFKHVPWRTSQVFDAHSRMDHFQFLPATLLNVGGQMARPAAGKYGSGLLASKCSNHGTNDSTFYVKRQCYKK